MHDLTPDSTSRQPAPVALGDAALPPDDATIVRAMRARADCKAARSEGAGELVRRVGGAVALRGEYIRRVAALTADELDQLDDILGWLLAEPAATTPVQLEVPPVKASTPLAADLARRGFACESFQSLLARRPGCTAEPVPPGVTLEPVDPANADQLSAFARVFVDAFDLTDGKPHLRDDLVARIAAEHSRDVDRPRWRITLARVDGAPAGLGTLYLTADRIGWFANGATLPGFRGRGVHRALTLLRLQQAADAGVEFVGVDTSVNSAAERNLHRAGFRLLAHYGRWGRPAS